MGGHGTLSGNTRLRLTIMPLKDKKVRVVLMVRFQSFLLGLTCRRRDGPDLRAGQMPQVAQTAGHSVQIETGTDCIAS